MKKRNEYRQAMKNPNDRRLKLVKEDPWLEASEEDINIRYERFTERLKSLEKHAGSLNQFADAYKYFGINYSSKDKGWYYREWAPAAHALYLFGDFNDWDRDAHPLSRKDNGVWELFLDEKTYKKRFVHGSRVKVRVDSRQGSRDRIPAYIRRVEQDMETKDFTAQVWLPGRFKWESDKPILQKDTNLFIYEAHIGMAQEKEGVGTYTEFAENILPHVKDAGYNAIQLMAIAEHPYYGSFGYHVSNFFAPSSRFGTPEELKELIKAAHKMGVAVIMDIVHSHTVKNINEGINDFDGSDTQYFHPGERGEHPHWDSRLFDYGKIEVLQFLLSNVKYWLQEFHFDGFRFDGVGSMMYFHHGYESFDRREKFFREGVEYDAVTYLQLANQLIHNINKNAVSIAEDVTGMPGLTHAVNEGGLGFDYRLGMGIPDFWTKLLKEYRDEQWNIHEMWHVLTDRVPGVKTVAYAESHDQALVGDKTIAFWLMDKEMYYHMRIGDQDPVIDRGISLHKLIRLFTLSLGGNTYLNFMGNEFGHPEWIDFPREGNDWSYKHARRQWTLLHNDDLKYKYLYAFDKQMIKTVKLGNIFADEYARQLNMDEANKTIIFQRGDLIFIFNFHVNHSIPDYEFVVPEEGEYMIILNSDSKAYGGFNRIDDTLVYPAQYDPHSGMYRVRLYLTNRTVLVLRKF